MAVLEIVHIGAPVLKEVAQPVTKINKQIITLLDDMIETMYAANGVGLAAPQVGESKRVIVIDVGDGIIEVINPVIIKAEGEKYTQEGCLSVPGMFGDVQRAEKVVVEGLNRQGRKIRVTGTDLLAVALQHEIDHLEGQLFIDKAVNIKKDEN